MPSVRELLCGALHQNVCFNLIKTERKKPSGSFHHLCCKGGNDLPRLRNLEWGPSIQWGLSANEQMVRGSIDYRRSFLFCEQPSVSALNWSISPLTSFSISIVIVTRIRKAISMDFRICKQFMSGSDYYLRGVCLLSSAVSDWVFLNKFKSVVSVIALGSQELWAVARDAHFVLPVMAAFLSALWSKCQTCVNQAE